MGRATDPEAQGPLKVPRGKGLSVEFKNPMDLTTEFTAQARSLIFGSSVSTVSQAVLLDGLVKREFLIFKPSAKTCHRRLT